MSFTEQAQELDAQIRSTIERAMDDLRTQLRRRFEESLESARLSLPETLISEDRWSALVEPAVEAALTERVPEPTEPAAADATELRDALARLDAARTQADVLRTLVEEGTRFASRTAVFLIRAGAVRGWGDQGLDVDWSQQTVDPSSGAWQRLLGGTGAQVLSSSERADVASRWDATVPAEAALIPLVLRDRIAAALYADRVGNDDVDVPALQVLTYVGALAIETLPLRERPATSTLILEAPPEPVEPVEPVEVEEAETLPEPADAVEAAPPTPVEEAPTPPEPVPEPEPEVEPDVEMEVEAEEPELAVSEDTDFGAADLGEVDLEVEEESAPVPTESIPLEAEDMEEPEAVEETAWVVEEEEPTEPVAAEPEAEPVPQPAESAPEPPPPGAAPPPPPGDAPEEARSQAPTASGKATAGGETPQVRPPEDVQGPGWAFSSAPQQKMDDEEEARHEEARRLARLLISEIKLYNEDQVQEGRKNNDVAERLKEDIDRSRQLYEERVDPRVRDTTDYFYQEMVRLLGAGDPKTLGI